MEFNPPLSDFPQKNSSVSLVNCQTRCIFRSNKESDESKHPIFVVSFNSTLSPLQLHPWETSRHSSGSLANVSVDARWLAEENVNQAPLYLLEDRVGSGRPGKETQTEQVTCEMVHHKQLCEGDGFLVLPHAWCTLTWHKLFWHIAPS